MNLLRIKWENIFAIITGSILFVMTIKFTIQNGFDFNVIMFQILYATTTITITRWSFKLSRRFFLQA